MVTQLQERPQCPACGSKTIYVQINGAIVCRRCGAVTPKTK